MLVATPARSGPAGSARVRWVVPTQAPWAGGPVRLLVLEARRVDGRLWLRVRLPVRPNDASGWIPADRVRLERTAWRVRIDRATRRGTVERDGRTVLRFGVVIGAPATPTPAGHFAIAEEVRQRDADGFIGPWALHLTAHSDVLDDYGGGPGRVAIHGRDGASFADPLGSARSHGCIRVSDHVVRWLQQHLAPGTPVTVT